MANPRVHELAAQLGIESSAALSELAVLGFHAKGPSSSVPPPVARKLRERLTMLTSTPDHPGTANVPDVDVASGGLQFDVCASCGERHALQRNGAMSVHATATGARCPGSGAAFNPPPAAEKREPKAKRSTEGPTKKQAKADAEREAAFKAATKHPAQQPTDKFDRKIYAVRGVHTVRGGAPGLGKRG